MIWISRMEEVERGIVVKAVVTVSELYGSDISTHTVAEMVDEADETLFHRILANDSPDWWCSRV